MGRRNKTGYPGLYVKNGKFVFQPSTKGGKRIPPVHLGIDETDFVAAIGAAEAIRERDFIQQETEPLEELIEQFRREKIALAEHSGGTINNARFSLNHFRRNMRCRPAEINAEKIKAWKKTLIAEGKAPSSILSYMRYAQSFCSWLVHERKAIHRNPFQSEKGLFPRKIPTRRGRACPKHLRDRLISNCQDAHLKAVLFIGFHAGLRRAEILSLRPESLLRDGAGRVTHFQIENQNDALEHFDIKDRDAKIVPASDPLADFLETFDIDYGPFIIRPDKPGKQKGYRWDWRSPWSAYMSAQGAEWVTPHVLRHTWFSLLLSAENPPSLLQMERWSGTEAKTILKSYAHLFENREAINAAN